MAHLSKIVNLQKIANLSKNVELSRIKQHLSFDVINRILVGACIILVFFLLLDFLINPARKIEERILTFNQILGRDLEVPGVTAAARPKPISYYTEALSSRNIFTAKAPDTAGGSPSATFREMVAKLRLQGIVSGTNPQAIIEDTKTHQVYFLSPGERIGEIELQEILPGKVILNYYGQEAELGL